ncbi:hypothetical protein F183_A06340 [Bryobacterales bacterium F-183]|nr:hypothetical protein F183_A06340 [Bryobacterales bacterium F-183]
MGLASELLADARELAQTSIEASRESLMRRAVSTAYYAAFHLFVEEFVSQWPIPDQRPRLGRMFDHRKMRDAVLVVHDSRNPDAVEADLLLIKTAFGQLQAERHKADYDVSWPASATQVRTAVGHAELIFARWQAVREDDRARNYLLSMFGANR